ncbi:WD40 repeat domain-containing protein [Phytomonospora endophytica]|uniref:WD40 repeat protein n=1 Tax=Phytomonospora endophytica TaxID=714109 RepID=A0A841FRN8_9ACTN|nr:hypothetical protein [Phytomonospora endophytica]MBB6036212.1 WD40 repeat protein [Phytomonospora endophytica]
MASPTLLLSSKIPSDCGIDDFDLVAHGGRLLAVCADSVSNVYSWDPAADRWREHPLESPFDDPDIDIVEIVGIAAVEADGRIVVGGGADHQPFALWDLETGAVRSHARLDHAGVRRARGGVLGGRPVLVAGDGSVPPRLRIWDARGDDATEPPEFHAGFESTGDVAIGEYDGNPVVVWGQGDGTVTMWDVAKGEASHLPRCPVGVTGVGMATVDGEERVVVAGEDLVALADPHTGEWFEPEPSEEDEEYDEDEDESGITCMDTGVLAGRPVAVVGTADGRIQLWDLTTPRPIGEPARGHEEDVNAVRVTVLDGRTVAITAGRDDHMRVWDLAPVVDW